MYKNLQILVINLKSSSDRRSKMSQQLENLSIPYHFLDATEGDNITREWIDNNIGERLKTAYLNRAHPILTKNALACADSHRRAQKIASEFKDGYTLILEDDVVFSKSFLSKINHLIRVMDNHSLNMAFLGYNWAKGTKEKKSDISINNKTGFSLYKYPIDGHVSGSFAYLVNNIGAGKLVQENYEKIQYMADTFRLQEKNMISSTVVLYPKIITTGYLPSEIGYLDSSVSFSKKIKEGIIQHGLLSSNVGKYLLQKWKERRW